MGEFDNDSLGQSSVLHKKVKSYSKFNSFYAKSSQGKTLMPCDASGLSRMFSPAKRPSADATS